MGEKALWNEKDAVKKKPDQIELVAAMLAVMKGERAHMREEIASN